MIRPPLPRWLALPAGAAGLFLLVPLLALLVRVPWTTLPSLLTAPGSVDALWLSLRTCALTTLQPPRHNEWYSHDEHGSAASRHVRNAPNAPGWSQ